jgi:hypothetical protein
MTLSGLTCWRNILNSLSICSLVVAINFIAMRAQLHFTLASVSLKLEFCCRVAREPELQEWIKHPNRKEKMRYSVTQDMSDAIDRFYFNHYCKSFRGGAFARASSSMYVLFGRYLIKVHFEDRW